MRLVVHLQQPRAVERRGGGRHFGSGGILVRIRLAISGQRRFHLHSGNRGPCRRSVRIPRRGHRRCAGRCAPCRGHRCRCGCGCFPRGKPRLRRIRRGLFHVERRRCWHIRCGHSRRRCRFIRYRGRVRRHRFRYPVVIRLLLHWLLRWLLHPTILLSGGI